MHTFWKLKLFISISLFYYISFLLMSIVFIIRLSFNNWMWWNLNLHYFTPATPSNAIHYCLSPATRVLNEEQMHVVIVLAPHTLCVLWNKYNKTETLNIYNIHDNLCIRLKTSTNIKWMWFDVFAIGSFM